jgi:hypothetical protein
MQRGDRQMTIDTLAPLSMTLVDHLRLPAERYPSKLAFDHADNSGFYERAVKMPEAVAVPPVAARQPGIHRRFLGMRMRRSHRGPPPRDRGPTGVG